MHRANGRDTDSAPAQPSGAQPAASLRKGPGMTCELGSSSAASAQRLIELGGVVVKAGMVELTGDAAP